MDPRIIGARARGKISGHADPRRVKHYIFEGTHKEQGVRLTALDHSPDRAQNTETL